jgi:fibronectin type 3 domain-containing protein
MGKYLCILSVILGVAVAGCSSEVEAPNRSLPLPVKPETPRGLTASVGDREIGLSWTVGDTAAADHFMIYFSDSAVTAATLLDSTDSNIMSYTATGLVNGRPYYFRVATVDTAGLEGDKSSPAAATPGIFAIIIESDREYTKTRDVTITVTAPQGVNLMQLSEDASFTGAHWESYGGTKSFELSDGDGLKTVYARFQINAGGNSVSTVSDDIILDRSAAIDSVKVSYPDLSPIPSDLFLGPGDTVHFSVYTTEDGQLASVDIAGGGTVVLNDMGVNGDRIAGDHIFEADDIIPDETELISATVTAHFTDVAGNIAPARVALYKLNVTSPPEAVAVWGYAVSSLEIQVLWTATDISDFSRYRVFRAESTVVGVDSTLVTQITQSADAEFLDENLKALQTYGYWVYVEDTHGNDIPSEITYIRTLANVPPDSVTIAVNTTGDSLAAKISWARPSTAADFEAYYIVRSDTSTGSFDPDLVIDFITSQQTTSYTDRSIPAPGTYYYRVYVADIQGLKSPSNEVLIDIP